MRWKELNSMELPEIMSEAQQGISGDYEQFAMSNVQCAERAQKSRVRPLRLREGNLPPDSKKPAERRMIEKRLCV